MAVAAVEKKPVEAAGETRPAVEAAGETKPAVEAVVKQADVSGGAASLFPWYRLAVGTAVAEELKVATMLVASVVILATSAGSAGSAAVFEVKSPSPISLMSLSADDVSLGSAEDGRGVF